MKPIKKNFRLLVEYIIHVFAQVIVMGKGRCSIAFKVVRNPVSCLGSVTYFLGDPQGSPPHKEQ